MTSSTSNRLLVGVVLGLVVAAAVAGLVIVGSPAEARMRRLDERRVEDLSTMSAAVDVYRTQYGRLPESLEELATASGTPFLWKDPAAGPSYGYRKIDVVHYELCANFQRPSDGDIAERPRWPSDLSWAHGPGRHCFRRESRPQQR